MITALKTILGYRETVPQQTSASGQWQRLLIVCMVVGLCTFMVLPVIELMERALQNRGGEYIGFENFFTYFSSPSLFQSAYHTVTVAVITTVISVGAALLYAYAIERTRMKGKTFFTYMALLPLFAPTMMYGISLIYLFGNNGVITTGFFGTLEDWFGIGEWDFDIYGLKGIVLSEVIFTFPQAFLILKVALSTADQRLYEAADTLGASKLRKVFTVTLPNIKYGLVSAIFVCFTLSFTDFGAPKVVGGQYNVLATDVYKQVIGQQNFSMGATVGIILTIPAVIAFVVDQIIQRKKEAGVSSRAVPYKTPPNKRRDHLYTLYCSTVSGMFLLLFGAIVAAAFVKVWPYDFSLTFRHFGFGNVAGDGLKPYWNSLLVSGLTAVIGTFLIFLGAYLVEKSRYMKVIRKISYFLSILPIALPGLVIGLAFIFFFNQQMFQVPFTTIEFMNPFNWLYGSVFILVLANLVHFYSVSFLTATTSLKQQDKAYESVSEAMDVPFYKTFVRVTMPLSLPAILEMAMYLFVNSMTTISAVVFLYSPEWKLASIAMVNMDDAGDIAPAAAMALLIIVTNILVRTLYEVASRFLFKKTHAWKR
ncbi:MULTISPECIES: putative 2-aminoethylphosphonate ABC transporter permease subunit [Pontibacillus]|uniref:2-aminoethylphosphonate ABC transporter permease subunit n=1 Tax=Pontibacillus chungwhensis TaxID=265426 RepID=A0ABY8V0J9_9BACI|nr:MULTISPECIES: putative 2-aminoethylphosphonate ABC transporter permease subunit [Pontibacillus]MCD5325776.1 putative 2-aminoethylphosphonate ABC transporter permease subunit [Pontibacillus sp. HN14]WIF98309.1 putative 2-aminoethylphosphonate ABC transporter permease subunit [Pontibacillus chungwhensis]